MRTHNVPPFFSYPNLILLVLIFQKELDVRTDENADLEEEKQNAIDALQQRVHVWSRDTFLHHNNELQSQSLMFRFVCTRNSCVKTTKK